MRHHQKLKDILPLCPCCNGKGSVANQPCCSGCDGTGIYYNRSEIRQLDGTSPQAGLWYVRRYSDEFPFGPGSQYFHRDGSWQPSTIGDDGQFTGFFKSPLEIAEHLI